jgi:hypothetical protein
VNLARCPGFLALVPVLLSCAACITTNTAEVYVRHPESVSLETNSGAPLLPAGQSDAFVAKGTFGILPPEPYEVRARRDSGGSIALECDTCDAQNGNLFMHDHGVSQLGLLDAAGHSRPVPSWKIDIDREKVSLSFDEDCLVRDHYSCVIPANVRLVAPTSDVVEVRRKSTPIRWLGYFLLVAATPFLAGGTYATASSTLGPSFGDRAPFAIGAFVPGVLAASFGLWEILAPAHEQVWKPSPPFAPNE